MNQGVRRGLVVALAGVLVIALTGIAGGKIKTKTFSSGDINKTIVDPPFSESATTTYDFTLNKKKFKRAKVKDVDLAVRISHDDAEDLTLSLSHRGRTVDLSTRNGSTTDDPEEEAYGSGSRDCNGTFTVFNDEAETAIEDGAMPWPGQFKPEERLSVFDGTKLKGKWTLSIQDYAAIFGGELDCTELEIKYKKKKRK
jgi:subtilisin-like proprotein convertase family protein